MNIREGSQEINKINDSKINKMLSAVLNSDRSAL